MNTITLRKITPADNPVLAQIIRSTLKEFKANKPGTVYYDESTDRLSEVFTLEKSMYFIAETDNSIVGGAGIYPTEGLPPDTCELVKMYLLPGARGKGVGKTLIHACFDHARQLGYKKMYLETMPELKAAIGMYEKSGFIPLKGPIGNSGHHGCDIWMMKEL